MTCDIMSLLLRSNAISPKSVQDSELSYLIQAASRGHDQLNFGNTWPPSLLIALFTRVSSSGKSARAFPASESSLTEDDVSSDNASYSPELFGNPDGANTLSEQRYSINSTGSGMTVLSIDFNRYFSNQFANRVLSIFCLVTGGNCLLNSTICPLRKVAHGPQSTSDAARHLATRIAQQLSSKIFVGLSQIRSFRAVF